MQIHAVAVDLPDLDEGVANRRAGRGQNPPAQVRDDADRRRHAVPDDDQIVIGVERESIRIERPFSLPRRERELFSEQPRNGEEVGSRKRRRRVRGAPNEGPSGRPLYFRAHRSPLRRKYARCVSEMCQSGERFIDVHNRL